MRLHTSVMSLGPLHSYKGAPPDMLSGGGRQILASYTEFSYQGNFLDAACLLIDTLPHQSPAMRSGRKALYGGRKKGRGWRRSSTGDPTDAVVESGAEEKTEMIRHHSGDHVFYLYITTTLCLLCVTDGLPIDEEVFEYLALVARKVSAAVVPFRKADADKVRRAASHALIDSMNTWTSKANGGSYSRSHSPKTIRSSTSVGGQPGTSSSPNTGERYTLKLCLVEAVRRLRIERVEKNTAGHKGNSVDGGGGVDTAAQSPAVVPSPLQLVAPEARRPRPSLRGPVSPGPRVRVAADGGSSPRSDGTPVTSASVLPTDYDEVSPSRPKSFPNGFTRQAQFKGFHASDETSSFSPVSSMASAGQGNAGKSTPTPVLVDLEFDLNEASMPERGRDTSPAERGGMTMCSKSVSLPLISSEKLPSLMNSLKESRGPVVSLDLPRGERLCGDLGMGRSRSLNTTPGVWDNSPSPSTVVRPKIVRAATPPAPASLLPMPLTLSPTPPMVDPPMVGGHNPLPSGPSSQYPGYGPPGASLHPSPPSQQQWHSVPTHQAAPVHGAETQMGIGAIPRFGSAPPGTTVGLSGSTWVQMAGVGGSTASPPAVATTPAGGVTSLNLSTMAVQQLQTWATSENVSVPLAVGAPIVSTRTTTVAEERLRRRRLEGLAGGEKGCSRVSLDGQSTEFRRSSNAVGQGRRALGSGSVGREGGHNAGMPQGGALSPRSSPRSMGPHRGGAVSPISPHSSASFSPNGSPFGHLNGMRRSLTPPPLQGERRLASAVGGVGCSIDPSRRYPSGVEGRSGRSESVPPRLRSSSGSLLEVEIEELSAGIDEGDRRVSDEGKSTKLGLLLPLDYSGMSTVDADPASGDAPLLRDFDGMARNALKAQVEVSKSDDDLLAVLTKFRDTLLSIPLPPPTAVDYEQALKDARRESIQLNGRLFEGNVEELLTTLRELMHPLVVGDESLMLTVCQDIVRASSRTSSGGDAYSVMSTLLSRPTEGDILTPSGAESVPIEISVDAAEGEVVITVENSFLLRRNAMDESGKVVRRPTGEKGTLLEKMARARGQLDEFVEQTAEQFRKMKGRREGWGGPGWSLEVASTKRDRGSSEESAADEPAGILFCGKMEVYLRLLDGSSKRRLRITCPIVERCPPECILLGAGTNAANGTYELAGFRNGGPIYAKGDNDVTISKECLGGREGWIIGRPPNRVLYGQPGNMNLPPELHWSLLNGGSGQNPPPTLMMHSLRRAKENTIDIRQMPTPRQRWAIGPNVTFLDDKDRDLVSSVSSARSPTPATPPN